MTTIVLIMKPVAKRASFKPLYENQPTKFGIWDIYGETYVNLWAHLFCINCMNLLRITTKAYGVWHRPGDLEGRGDRRGDFDGVLPNFNSWSA